MPAPCTSFRAPRVIREALERAAERETRSLAHQALRYVREGLARDGYLPPADDTPREVAA